MRSNVYTGDLCMPVIRALTCLKVKRMLSLKLKAKSDPEFGNKDYGCTCISQSLGRGCSLHEAQRMFATYGLRKRWLAILTYRCGSAKSESQRRNTSGRSSSYKTGKAILSLPLIGEQS